MTARIPLTLPDPERDHISGSADGLIRLLEYGDYECPFCAGAHVMVKEIQRRLGDDLLFAFRNFPLTNIHPHAEHAAEAAEAAGKQGNFWGMHDLLFENQGALEDDNLAAYAAELGLDQTRLIREVVWKIYTQRIREDFKSGVRGGVNGTPTFFINGERYDGTLDLEHLLNALTAKLWKIKNSDSQKRKEGNPYANQTTS
jgi:protein-disulfide isomerase